MQQHTPMLPVRLYAPRQPPPEGAVRANVTSKANGVAPPNAGPLPDEVFPFPALSPFHLGPVSVYAGSRALDARRMENGWQYTKLYEEHSDCAAPTKAHARWLLDGIRANSACRFPMGRGAKPLCAIWRNRTIGYVEARLLIYIPMYVEAMCRDRNAFRAFEALRALHARCSAAGRELALFDFDGYDHVRRNDTLATVIANGNKKMGHAFVLAALLEGQLIPTINAAAELAGLEPPSSRDLPPDLRAIREEEQLPRLVGGAIVYYRHEFLNRLSDRCFGALVPFVALPAEHHNLAALPGHASGTTGHQ